MRYIFNSAVITSPGEYRYELITMGEALTWLSSGDWQSTIGYKETADALERISGMHIPVNKVLVKMNVGDEALVFRLTKRIKDVKDKGKVGLNVILNNSEIGILERIR